MGQPTRRISDAYLLTVLAYLLMSPFLYGNTEGGIPFKCPEEHIYVYCGELYDNLDHYGYPKAYGYDKIHVEGPWVTKHLDKCGKGKIIRKWKVKYHYDWYWCEQTIHITDPHGGHGFNGHHDVYWPKDYHMKECGGSLHPDKLPKHYNWPEFDHYGCAKLGLRYHDKTVPYHSTAYGYGHNKYGHNPCKVIHRTWELIDWCQYQSSYGGGYGHATSKGKWTYLQKIYVYDHEAPTITFCSDDIEVTNGDCDGEKVFVDIPKVKAKDDCGAVYFAYSRKKVESSSEYHSYSSSGVSYSGSDASGYYEPGQTLVTFKAFDVCGNTTECQVVVDVKAVDNKPPTVIGISSITAVLVQSDTNEGKVEVWPEEFNSSSVDNCTSPENLKFELEPSVFTCEDFGSNQVKFIVTDEAGNSDYIMVEVIVQANSFECLGGVISGEVMSDEGQGVDGVEVTLMQEMQQMTDQEGKFAFDNIPLGREIMITPYKNTDVMEGVDMYDYTLLSLHVDGIRTLKDPYDLIAADINGDQTIDFSDLLAMQRLIIGLDKKMGNEAWKIFDRRFQFPDTLDPLEVKLPDHYIISPYNGGNTNVQFMAVKVGDIGQLTIEAPSQDIQPKEINIVTKDRLANQNEIITVPFRFGDDVAGLRAFSLSLDLDPASWSIMGISKGKFHRDGVFEAVVPEEDQHGSIAITWFAQSDRSFTPDDILFEIELKALRADILSRSLSLAADLNSPTAISVSEGLQSVRLDLQRGNQVLQPILMQNAPNPFQQETTIEFYMPANGTASLEIRDANGRVVWHSNGEYLTGYQRITVDRNELGVGGLLFYQLVAGDHSITKKMLVID